MRQVIHLILVVLIFGCTSNQNESIKESRNIELNNNLGIEEQSVSLNGLWALTNYFDTIISNKELAKYRLQAPTWFAILLQINNDSLVSYGSLIELNKEIRKEADTLTMFDTYGGLWSLVRCDSILFLKQEFAHNGTDTTVYKYRRRNDLSFMTENMDRGHKISSNVTTYFNEMLLVGFYRKPNSNDTIKFTSNGEIIGFRGFDRFQVRNYFGTLHPHKNLDVVTFYNSITKSTKEYNWKFEGELLVLTEFVPDTVFYEGEKIISDDYILGREMMELLKF